MEMAGEDENPTEVGISLSSNRQALQKRTNKPSGELVAVHQQDDSEKLPEVLLRRLDPGSNEFIRLGKVGIE